MPRKIILSGLVLSTIAASTAMAASDYARPDMIQAMVSNDVESVASMAKVGGDVAKRNIFYLIGFGLQYDLNCKGLSQGKRNKLMSQYVSMKRKAQGQPSGSDASMLIGNADTGALDAQVFNQFHGCSDATSHRVADTVAFTFEAGPQPRN